MKKQKKQLIVMFCVLVFAIAALVFVSKLPAEEETEENQNYAITDLDQDKINRFSYTNAGGMYNFTRQGEEWLNEDDKALDVDEEVIDRMVGKVASLTSQNRIEQVEDRAQYGLEIPAVSILISDGTTAYTLLIGDYNELTGTYYLCLESDQGTVYTADSYTVSEFIEKNLDDLIVQEQETETEMQ